MLSKLNSTEEIAISISLTKICRGNGAGRCSELSTGKKPGRPRKTTLATTTSFVE